MALSKIGTFFDELINFEEYSDAGSTGERFLYRELKGLFFSNRLLRNVYLPKANGNLSEIDLLAVGQKGIYVFESKNYSGLILGGEEDTHWMQMLNKATKNRFYNPINQNNSHIKTLQFNLADYPSLKYYNIVVFNEQCTLKNKPITLPDTYVIKRDMLEKTINKIISTHKEVISSQQMKEIIKLLSKTSRPDSTVKERHIDQSKTKCPYCGNELVERASKKTSEKFYGCKGYPKCRFTKAITE